MISNRLATMILAFCITFGFLAIVALGALFETQSLKIGPDSVFCREALLTAQPGISQGQATPTLAPPRDKYFAQQALHCGTSAKGRSIFLHVEADSDEIEVSWASP